MNNLTVIVRHNNERTFSSVLQHVQSFVNKNNILIVNEKPIEKSIRKIFNLAETKISTDWILVIDADIFVSARQILVLLDTAKSYSKNTFYQAIGKVKDKILMCTRDGGPRLYYRPNMRHASKYIPADNDQITPEYYIWKRMGKDGFDCKHSGIVLGIHDYGQFYHDCFSKTLTHMAKHRQIVNSLIPIWSSLKEHDIDYLACLEGSYYFLRHGRYYNKQDISAIINKTCGGEKKEINSGEINSIKEMIDLI